VLGVGEQSPCGDCIIGSMHEENTPADPDALLSLVQQLKENYQTPPPMPRRRGKPRDFSALSFLLLAAVAVVLRTFKDSELHKLLSRDCRLRQGLGFARVPHRTTIGRRLRAQGAEAEAQIAALGQQLLAEVKPEADQSAVSALDGRMYEAQGPAWHKSSRQAGVVPAGLRNVDTESAWSKSGYRGWVQGYRLVLQSLVWPAPVPLFAAWRPNNHNEAVIAATALAEDHLVVTEVLLGDETFGGADFIQQYAAAGGWVLTPKQLPGKYHTWKCDLYAYRKETIELLFQRVIQASGLKECQVKGLGRNGAFVLASVWLYQILFLVNYRHGRPAAEIKDLIDDARWRIST
jgi:hypothetical protein